MALQCNMCDSMNTFVLKQDKYRKVRGGHSRFLNIMCASCDTKLFLYQKDGPGPLKRAYLDRIHAPEKLVGLEKIKPIEAIANIVCKKCKITIGMSYVYAKERRGAFLLRPGFFLKKLTKGVWE